jgi:oxygen-independent coproporphyrinogen-3 oxidase
VQLQPDHLSAYGLIVEDQTPLSRLVQARQVSPQSSDAEAEFFELTMNTLLKYGFEHYEISNYARPGFRAQHNLNYWRHGNYLGFGPSAHSFCFSPGRGHRWWNISNISTYIRALNDNRLPVAGDEWLSADALMVERLFLGLRSDGVRTEDFNAEFGNRFLTERSALIDDLVRTGLMTFSGNTLSLTSTGYLICDEVSVRLAG